MATASPSRPRASEALRRRLRLGSGLVLFAYVALHLLNHSLGLVSIEAAEAGLAIALRVWHGAAGTLLLAAALVLHVALAFDALLRRRTFRLASMDGVRVLMGLGIPLLLVGHVVSTRGAWELAQQSPHYARVVWQLWTGDAQGRQIVLLVPGWLHGCFGIHLAFRHRRRYRRWLPVLTAAAAVLPLLAGLGFLSMARTLAFDVPRHALLDAALRLSPEVASSLAHWREGVLGAYAVACAGVLLVRATRAMREARAGRATRS